MLKEGFYMGRNEGRKGDGDRVSVLNRIAGRETGNNLNVKRQTYGVLKKQPCPDLGGSVVFLLKGEVLTLAVDPNIGLRAWLYFFSLGVTRSGSFPLGRAVR